MQMRQRMRGGCVICNSVARRSCFYPIVFKRLIFYSPLA
ncbi:TPA: hypothetical protein ACGBUC_001014 [Klebsiella variicola]|nr:MULTISPECIES: hypothetical protein [Klebsiella]QHW95785.1 hypothetical protein GZS05_04760 [Klebsiella variicola]HCI9592680.1 hypothetical protein [Klebsiella variicola]